MNEAQPTQTQKMSETPSPIRYVPIPTFTTTRCIGESQRLVDTISDEPTCQKLYTKSYGQTMKDIEDPPSEKKKQQIVESQYWKL